MPGIDMTSAINGRTAVLQEAGISAAVSPASVSSFSNTVNKKLQSPSNLDSIFEEASRKHQVPVSLLKAVAKAESDFNPSAVSRSGAQGVMQLMPGTARELGVTDSFDPRQNIMGGAKYISQMLNKYDGNTKLALAAYNAGSNNVDKYGGIPPFKETQNYVVKVMKYAGSDLSTITPSTASVSKTSKAGSAIQATTTPNVSYTNQDQSLLFQNVLQSIFNFNDFNTDDYLLFLELIKSSLQTPTIGSSYENSNNYLQDSLYGSRIQNLF